jgi:hypothetical protein
MRRHSVQDPKPKLNRRYQVDSRALVLGATDVFLAQDI